jgi:hypothetical protein
VRAEQAELLTQAHQVAIQFYPQLHQQAAVVAVGLTARQVGTALQAVQAAVQGIHLLDHLVLQVQVIRLLLHLHKEIAVVQQLVAIEAWAVAVVQLRLVVQELLARKAQVEQAQQTHIQVHQ